MTNATSEVSGAKLGNEDTGSDEADRQRLVGVLIGGRKRRELRALLIGELLRSRGDEAEEKDEDEGAGTDLEHKLLGFVIGRGLRRGRLRRMLLAELIRSRGEESEDEDEDENEGGAEDDGASTERKLLGFVIGRGVRRRRLRHMLLAELIRSRGEESEDEDEDEGGADYDGGSTERKLVGFVIGRGARRKRLRRMLLAQLIRSRGEESEDEGEDGESEGGGLERKLLGFVIGRGLRRRRLRRMLVAQLIRSRGEESDDESDDEDSDDASASNEDQRLVRLLIGGRMARRTKMRRMLLGEVLRA